MTEPQYIEAIREGDFVTFGNKRHKVIFNGDPHIQFRENGKRKRVYLKDMIDFKFEYGSEPDWIFNEWYQLYPDYETFRSFAEKERMELLSN